MNLQTSIKQPVLYNHLKTLYNHLAQNLVWKHTLLSPSLETAEKITYNINHMGLSGKTILYMNKGEKTARNITYQRNF